MANEIIETPLIDPNIDSYKQFFDHEWARQIFALAENTAIQEAVNHLMVSWRSANGAHLLPWLMVDSLRGYAKGEHLGSLEYRSSYSGRVVKHLVDTIAARMHPKLKYDQRASLKRAVVQIEKEAYVAMRTAQDQVGLDVAEYWKFLTESREFPFCILGTQIVNYCSLFFAYEDFIANFLRIKNPEYSSLKNKNTAQELTIGYGSDLGDYCWTHPEIELARLVRNELAHNGGRRGEKLNKYAARFVDSTEVTNPELHADKFNLVNSKIQIAPDNTRYLFNILKDRVARIVNAIKE